MSTAGKMESDKTTEVPKQLCTTKSYYGQIQIIKWGGGISVEKKKIKGNLASDVSTNSEA